MCIRDRDEGSFEEWDKDLVGGNPKEYRGYEEKLNSVREKTGLQEAVVTGKGRINGREAVIGAVSYTHLDVYKRQHLHLEA